MPITAIIFDLDDTLVIQESTEAEIILDLAREAGRRHTLADPAHLAQLVFSHADRLYSQAPVVGSVPPVSRRSGMGSVPPASRRSGVGRIFAYGDAIGISAGECLWGRFQGDDPNLKALAAWAPTFRVEVWQEALLDVGIWDRALAEELAERFMAERRKRHLAFPEVGQVLTALQSRYRLALLTNGAPDMQREKLAGSGLELYFQVVAISGELGIGKPDPRIFGWVLERLDMPPGEAVMVGDSLPRDIAGARRAGIKGIWINRHPAATRQAPGIQPDAEIATLTRLPDVLKQALG